MCRQIKHMRMFQPCISNIYQSTSHILYMKSKDLFLLTSEFLAQNFIKMLTPTGQYKQEELDDPSQTIQEQSTHNNSDP
uniref:Uncharacterized protein n=1 Tax=Arion vulgaris TaxID=1028688 RepID=A0A0B7BTP1_9EUPU